MLARRDLPVTGKLTVLAAPAAPPSEKTMLSVETIAQVQDSSTYRCLHPVVSMTKRNVGRFGDTDAVRPTTSLFNHVTGPDPDEVVNVWENLTRW